LVLWCGLHGEDDEGMAGAGHWASPGPRARQTRPLAGLCEREGKEGLAGPVWKEVTDLAQGFEKNRKTSSFSNLFIDCKFI
jgi:hypothetical protein